MTNLNEKKARREELKAEIERRTRYIEQRNDLIKEYRARVKGSGSRVFHTFAAYDFDYSVMFSVTGGRTYCVTLLHGVECCVRETTNTNHPLTWRGLPVKVKEIISFLFSAMSDNRKDRERIEEARREFGALDAEIAALESEELPPPPAVIDINPAEPVRKTVKLVIKKDAPMVECPLNETAVSYDYADTIRNTLAERVEAREVIEAAEPDILDNGAAMFVGDEAGAFAHALNICGVSYVETGEGSSPAIYIENYEPTMAAVDADLIDDINESLFDIDTSDVESLLNLADEFNDQGRKAKAAGYRQVAQLAALYAVDDAIERGPELEGLLGALYDWREPAQLPPNVAAGIATAKDYTKRVLNISCLSADDLGERTRAYTIGNWSMENVLYRGMDDDNVAAFCLKPNAGVWISYMNCLWAFDNDGVVDANTGVFTSEDDALVETLRRYLGPDADDLY